MAGEEALFRYGYERAEGIPGASDHFATFSSESLDMTYTHVPNPDLDPSGNETEGAVLKGEGGGDITGSANSESWLAMRAHMHSYNEVSTPATGVKLWELRDEEVGVDTPIAYYNKSLYVGIYRAEATNPTEFFATGARATQFELGVNANDFATFKHSLIFLRDRYMRKPYEQAVNAGWTGDIDVVGHRAAGDEGGDYYKFKVTATDGALGTATILWGKGAGAYGTTEYVTSARMDVRNADDTLASGSSSIPFQILITAGGVFTEDDEWRIYPWATKPVPVYTARPKLHGAACELEITRGGTTITRVVPSFTLTHSNPWELDFGVARHVYAQRSKRPNESKRSWELNLDTTYESTELKQMLLHSSHVAAHIKLYGARIGSTAYEDFSEWTLPAMQLTQAGSTIQNAGSNPENPVLRAVPLAAGDPLCIEQHQNTVASITPA